MSHGYMTQPQKDAAHILLGDGWRMASVVHGMLRGTIVKMKRGDMFLVIKPSGHVKFNPTTDTEL